MCLQFNGLRFSTSTPTTQCIQLFDSKFPAVFHCQKVTDHSPCLPHFLLLNAESKSSSRTDEIRHYDCHVKFENNTSGRARLWDTALKFLCPGLSITSPDHLDVSAELLVYKHASGGHHPGNRLLACTHVVENGNQLIIYLKEFS